MKNVHLNEHQVGQSKKVAFETQWLMGDSRVTQAIHLSSQLPQ